MVLFCFGLSLGLSFAVFSSRLVSGYSYLVFLGVVIFDSFSLFSTSIIPSNKCLLTFRLLIIQNLNQTGIHKDWKSFKSVWHTQLLQTHPQFLPEMTFSYSQDNGICKVRQCWVHITGKLLLSTKSALKHSRHATVPNSGEFSLFAFWGCLGTVPSPGTKQQDEKAAPIHTWAATTPPACASSRDWQGSDVLWLQIFHSPNTSHSKDRQQDKILDTLPQEVPFLWRTLLGLHPWHFNCFWQLQEVEVHGSNMPCKRMHSLLLGDDISQKSKI